MDNKNNQEPETISEYNVMVRALQHAPSNKRLMSHIKWRLFKNRSKDILTHALKQASITALGTISPSGAWMLKEYLKP
jgi:hypothetical protein